MSFIATSLSVAMPFVAIFALQTFVAPSAFAAKIKATPDLESEKPEPTTPPTEEELKRAGEVDLTPAPSVPASKRQSEYFYPYHQALTVRGGVDFTLSELGSPDSVLSILYWFPYWGRQSLEAGADLGNDGTGTLHLAARQVFGSERFRPYFKIGGALHIVPKDELVTFLRLKNWQGRLAAGFEYLAWDPMSIRLEAEGVYSSERTFVLTTLGFVWGW